MKLKLAFLFSHAEYSVSLLQMEFEAGGRCMLLFCFFCVEWLEEGCHVYPRGLNPLALLGQAQVQPSALSRPQRWPGDVKGVRVNGGSPWWQPPGTHFQPSAGLRLVNERRF